MKTLFFASLILLPAFAATSAFAISNPLFVCDQTNETDRIVVQSQEQTPVGKTSIITVNDKKYFALRHQTIGFGDVQTFVYCVSPKALSKCSYGDENQQFVDLKIQLRGQVILLNVKSAYLNLNIDCQDGNLIWD